MIRSSITRSNLRLTLPQAVIDAAGNVDREGTVAGQLKRWMCQFSPGLNSSSNGCFQIGHQPVRAHTQCLVRPHSSADPDKAAIGPLRCARIAENRDWVRKADLMGGGIDVADGSNIVGDDFQIVRLHRSGRTPAQGVKYRSQDNSARCDPVNSNHAVQGRVVPADRLRQNQEGTHTHSRGDERWRLPGAPEGRGDQKSAKEREEHRPVSRQRLRP